MIFLALVLFAFFNVASGYGGGGYGNPVRGYDTGRMPAYLPISGYYGDESSSSSSDSDSREHCDVHKLKSRACPRSFRTPGTTCRVPNVRKVYIHDKCYAEIECKSNGRFTVLATSSAQVLVAGESNGKIVRVAKKVRDHKWSSYNATGDRIRFRHVYCLQGDLVSGWIDGVGATPACSSCGDLNELVAEEIDPQNLTFTISKNAFGCLTAKATCFSTATDADVTLLGMIGQTPTNSPTKLEVNVKARCGPLSAEQLGYSLVCDNQGKWNLLSKLTGDRSRLFQLQCSGARNSTQFCNDPNPSDVTIIGQTN